MKIADFSRIKRKSVAVLLTVCMLAAMIPGMQNLHPSALSVIDSHDIGSDDFETDNLSDWKKINSSVDASVSGGKLVLKGAGSSSSMDAMLYRDEQATEQRVRVNFNATNSINPEVWARVQTDSSGKVTGGYFVRFISGTQSAGKRLYLYRAYTDESNKLREVKLADLGKVGYEATNTVGIELIVSGTNPTSVTANLYKNAALAHKNVVVDNTAELQASGGAALTYRVADGATVESTFSALEFQYTSTDNEHGEYYISGLKGTAWHNTSLTFTQFTVLDPSKTYVFEALASKSNTQKLVVHYADTDGKAQSLFEADEAPKVSVSDDGYNLLRYEINLPLTAERNSDFSQYTDGVATPFTRVRVGHTRNYDNMGVAEFTRFTLYEKDDPNKTNLLVNGDFKMGFLGWITTGTGGVNDFQYFTHIAEGVATLNSSRGEVRDFDATAKENFKSNINVDDRDKLSYLNNTYYKLVNDKSLNVSYIGGSVTSGYGSSDYATKSWRALTTAWFEEKFPDAEINANNAAIGGTGSYLGLFRYETDVQSYQPDLLFIEFAINDRYESCTKEETIRNIESMIQTAYSRNQYIDIVLVGTFDKWVMDSEYDNIAAMKELAAKYNLMFIDLRTAFRNMLASTGTNFTDFITDNVHPNDKGYEYYASVITEKIASDIILTEPQVVSLIKKSAPAINLSSEPLMLDAELIQASDITFESNIGWNYENKTFSSLGNRNYSSRYITSTPGSTLTFKFVGTDIGILRAGKSDGGKFSCSIDGGTPIVIDTYRASANPIADIIGWNLENREHTLTITVLGEKNEASSDTSVEIGALLINGTLPINPNNEYMVHNMGTSANAQFGQIVNLKPDTAYTYSLYYKDISGDSKPDVWYIKSSDSTGAYTKLADTQYTAITKEEEQDVAEYYKITHQFKLPDDVKLESDGTAKILVGYDSGSFGSNTYYYGFKLTDDSDSTQTNLMINTNFKKGLLGWSSVGYNYVPDSTDSASVTMLKDAKLVKFEGLDFFKLASIDGDIMLHTTGKVNYSHITQFIDLEKGKTYRFSMRKKILSENSSKPYVWFKLNGKTGENDWSAVALTATEQDDDSLYFMYEFTVPDNATVSENGMVNTKVGVSTGSTGSNVYYYNLKLWAAEDNTETNLFKNADFSKGFKGWRRGVGTLIETLGVFEIPEAELLPFDETLFVNDTSDNMFKDGDWASEFGSDETYDEFIKRIYKLTGLQIPTAGGNSGSSLDSTADVPGTGDATAGNAAAAVSTLLLSLAALAFTYARLKKNKVRR